MREEREQKEVTRSDLVKHEAFYGRVVLAVLNVLLLERHQTGQVRRDDWRVSV